MSKVVDRREYLRLKKAEERANRKKAGHVQFKVWIPRAASAEIRDRIRKFAAKLTGVV